MTEHAGYGWGACVIARLVCRQRTGECYQKGENVTEIDTLGEVLRVQNGAKRCTFDIIAENLTPKNGTKRHTFCSFTGPLRRVKVLKSTELLTNVDM